MTYNEFIDNIILERGQWAEEVRLSKDRGCERHHILPNCMGGEGDYIGEDGKTSFSRHSRHPNCIYLYPAEHFIAHKLLAEENPHNWYLTSAWFGMCVRNTTCEEKYIFTPEEYEEARLLDCKGENNPMYGKKPWNYGLTKETDERVAKYSENLSKSKKGILKGPDSEETKRRKSESTKKRYIEHPESFICNTKDKVSITDGVNNLFIEKDEELPEGFRYGQTHIKYEIKDETKWRIRSDNISKKVSGINNPMYGKGYKIAGGNNGKATYIYTYKGVDYLCRDDLMVVLEKEYPKIYEGTIRKIMSGNYTKVIENRYKDLLLNLSWRLKNENKVSN